jgi:chromosome segregation ATPase
MKVFQKLNRELNEINKKRNVLEQVLLKKDKDLDEKDQTLFEKIAALEESERILNIRQVEIESTDQVLNSTREQREYLWNELQKLEDEAIERKSINEDLRLETDLLFKKKSVIEKNFQDLLNTMNQNYSKLRERNTGFQKEFKHYEDEFDLVRARISESMKELDEIQNAISTLKLEQEQHKGSISKLMSSKRRIQDEISKHQSILQRYQRIREKLTSEQSLSKYRSDPDTSEKIEPESNAQIYKI